MTDTQPPPVNAAQLEALRLEMFSQVPVLRSQIRAMRAQAEATAALVANAKEEDRIGLVVTSVMLAGFALELGLKMFAMTYAPERLGGHDLKELWKAIPETVRGDITATFEASTFPTPPAMVYAMTSSKKPPANPKSVRRPRYDTAENVIASSRNAFVKARYFFEGVKTAHWATIDHAVHYMVVVSNVLDLVYDAYAQAGGWDAVPRPTSNTGGS